MRNYLYKAKRLSEQLIKENSQLKDEIEEEYYKLLINIAKEKHSDFDLRKYYVKVSKLVK